MTQHPSDSILRLVAARRGHFLLESGHHGDLWLDLEHLCACPNKVKPFCFELAKRLSRFKVDIVCGPLVEGAFVALFVASELDARFVYSERFAKCNNDGLFPAGYRVPDSLRHVLNGKRTAIVNDVINAGSAVRGTFEDLTVCGAEVVAIGTLLVLGNSAQQFAESNGLVLESLGNFENQLWPRPACPLCAKGIPLEDLAVSGAPMRIARLRER